MKKIWQLVKQTFSEWSEDKAPRLAAGLAYYTVFSLAPLLVIVIAIASLVFDRQSVQTQIVQQFSRLVGTDSASAIQTMMNSARAGGGGLLATIVGIVTLLFGAAGVFGQLQDSMNTMWEVQPKPNRGLLGMIKDRFFSFSLVLGTGFLLLVSLVLSAALAALNTWALGLFPGFETIMRVVNFVVSFGIIVLLFALIFKYMPDAEVAWGDVWLGALVTAVLFSLGRLAIEFYINNSDFTTTYGAAGSVIVILLWVYYSAQILFLGAEFTQVYANLYGSRIRPAPGAMPVTEEKRAEEGIPRKSRQGLPPEDAVAALAQRSLPARQVMRGLPDRPAQPAGRQEPELLPEAQPSLLVFSAVLATLVGFISGFVVKRGGSGARHSKNASGG